MFLKDFLAPFAGFAALLFALFAKIHLLRFVAFFIFLDISSKKMYTVKKYFYKGGNELCSTVFRKLYPPNF